MGNKFYKKRRGSFIYLFAIFLAFGLAAFTAGVLHLKSLPSISQLEEYEPTLTSQIVSNDSVVIRTFGAYNYQKVDVSEIPENLKKAIVAIEDQNFYKHHGFDVIALVRSTIKNLKARKIVQGASTITQQLARILFLSQEKTFDRKFKELIIAHRLEKTITKDKILEMYLNNIYLGEGAYGVSAAADIYFDKEVKDLNLAECALIAGLPQAPSIYSPFQNYDLARKRRSMVISRMLQEGFIGKEEAKKAYNSDIVLSKKPKKPTLKKAPYFVDFVMKELREKADLSEQEVIQGGYKIYTTINYGLQKAAENSINVNLKGWRLDEPYQQAALISYDVVSGQILAYVGGKDYSTSQFDRVTQSVRPPGSSFKVFVYATAMEQGLTPFTVYPDIPFAIGDWSPQNYGKKYRRKLPLYKALALSSNVVAAQLIIDLGVNEVIRTARRLGITTPLHRDPTIALGSSGVKMIEMASAYGVLANGGIKVIPYGIDRVETSNGKIIYVANSSYKRVLDVKTVAYMVEMLKQVVKHGTGRASNISRPSAGKTGTTDNYRDAWFMGFTPDIVTGVWAGNDNNTPTNNLTGGSLPAVIWRDYMKKATAKKPVMNFMYPEIIVDTNYEPGIHEDIILEELEKEKQEEQEEDSDVIFEETKFEIDESKFNMSDNPDKQTAEKPGQQSNIKDEEPDDPDNTDEISDYPKKPEHTLKDFNPLPIPIKRVKVKNFHKKPPLPEGKKSVGSSGF